MYRFYVVIALLTAAVFTPAVGGLFALLAMCGVAVAALGILLSVPRAVAAGGTTFIAGVLGSIAGQIAYNVAESNPLVRLGVCGGLALLCVASVMVLLTRSPSQRGGDRGGRVPVSRRSSVASPEALPRVPTAADLGDLPGDETGLFESEE